MGRNRETGNANVQEARPCAKPHGEGSREYACMRAERMGETVLAVSAEPQGAGAVEAVRGNEGREKASDCGCNANNGNASMRTLNCNNAASNGNDNYAGAFAVIKEHIGKDPASWPARPNTTEGREATGVHGQCDYGLPPYCDGSNAESNAQTDRKEAIMKELETANSKRKLKNLRRFFLSPELIEIAFDRTMERAHSKKKLKAAYKAHKAEICRRLLDELTAQTYSPQPPQRRIIRKRGRDGKDREAIVYSLYDRIVQNLMLIVIERKLRRKFVRNIYSGIRGRSLLSNDRRYCMVNKIRHWVQGHCDSWVGLTDIRHFYQTLGMKLALGTLFKTVVCPYARWLLCTMFRDVDSVPIGGPLSQMMAMLAILDADRQVLRRWNVFYCCFGDNRLIGGGRQDVLDAMEFLKSYYAGAYALEVKGDYQARRVRNGFRFCKYDYKGSFVKVRAEARRRAIRAWKQGRKHWAGVRGPLLKTDSRHLMSLIETDSMEITNRHGMTVHTQNGRKLKFRDVPKGSTVVCAEYGIVPSTAKEKEGKTGWMARVLYVLITPDGKKELCHTTEGSEEILGFFRLVEEGRADLHTRLHIGTEGNKVFFEEYHTTAEEACDLICRQLGI